MQLLASPGTQYPVKLEPQTQDPASPVQRMPFILYGSQTLSPSLVSNLGEKLLFNLGKNHSSLSHVLRGTFLKPYPLSGFKILKTKSKKPPSNLPQGKEEVNLLST